MTQRNVFLFLCALGINLLLSGSASAQETTQKVGRRLPLSGASPMAAQGSHGEGNTSTPTPNAQRPVILTRLNSQSAHVAVLNNVVLESTAGLPKSSAAPVAVVQSAKATSSETVVGRAPSDTRPPTVRPQKTRKRNNKFTPGWEHTPAATPMPVTSSARSAVTSE